MEITSINSYDEMLRSIGKKADSFVLLYKSGSDLSQCALQNLESAYSSDLDEVQLFSVDVNNVKDIHDKYNIAPPLQTIKNLPFQTLGFGKIRAEKSASGRRECFF